MPRTHKQPQKSRHDPLFVQLNEDEVEAKYGRVSQPGKRKKGQKDDENDAGDVLPISFLCCQALTNRHQAILDPKTSRKIFELARDQQDELEMPDDQDLSGEEEPDPSFTQPRSHFVDEDEEEDELDDNDQEVEEEFVSTQPNLRPRR